MTDPELLLLDEPAAGLDLGGREALLRLLGRLADDPAAPVQVLVSHHVEEVPLGVTHALLLRSGRVVAAGPIESTLHSASLSAAFGLPLRVLALDGRWTARMAGGGARSGRVERPRLVVDLDRNLTQLGCVLPAVVGAEVQVATAGHHRAHLGLGATPVTAVGR